MALQELLIIALQEYTPLLAFFAGLLLGDALIVLAVLAGAGKISLWPLFVFGFLGEIVHDVTFYLIANSRLAFYLKRKLNLSTKESKIARFIERVGGKNYILPMFFAKFIYGVRDAMVLYIAHNEKNFKRYLLIIMSASIFWLSISLTIGWLAGQGFTVLLSILKGLERWLAVIALSIIAMLIAHRLVISALLDYIKKNKLLVKDKFWDSKHTR